ncbi:MAG: SlyX family protein [Pseudomonadota bacterium]
MNERELESRLDALESRQAFQDDAQNSLSDVLTRQGQDIAALRQQIDHLATRLQEALAASAAPAQDDDVPPPHY